MLIRRRVSVPVLAASAAAALVLIASLASVGTAAAGPASAPSPSGSVTCPPQDINPVTRHCDIEASGPGQSASTPSSAPSSGGSGGGGDPRCMFDSDPNLGPKVVDCYLDGFDGWYENGCYFHLANPQPPQSAPVWSGHPPGGAAYDVRCFAITKSGPTWPGTVPLPIQEWRLNPPPHGPGPTPAQLATTAIAEMTMSAPTIGIAPAPHTSGLVGLPVWLWDVQTSDKQTWGRQSKTAAVPGLSVTATATAESITWDMGDGHQVPCTKPGTAYDPSFGGGASPDCGYVYTQPSGAQPNGEYTITATTTWQITWAASNGQTGNVPPMKLVSTTAIKIGELQVVNR